MQTLHLSFFPDHVCEEHGIWDSLPCPWPGCRNGHTDDRFQAQVLMEGKAPTIYTRHQWHSPLGGNYYTWDGDDLPNWFSAPKTLWNEARRLSLAEAKAPELVYHYTTLEGLIGIVQSRSLWLSDYSYLNDTRELTYGVEMVRDVTDELLKAESDDNVTGLLQSWIRDIATLGHRVCIASFSAENDSLSQWRSYGPIAIGFEPHQLAVHASQTNLRAVEYDRVVQRKLVSVYLSHLCQAYVVDLKERRLDRIPDVYHRTDRLIELIAFFKDPAFRTEHEYRLAYIEYPETLHALEIPPAQKRFRVARSRLLPYVSSDDLFPAPKQRRPLEIHEIVLGPESDDLLERGVREFLASCALATVEVRRSTVPYRT